MSNKGIDVSHYQGEIDFRKVKNDGFKFVIIKATEGSEDGSKWVDGYFKENVNEANAVGLKVHAYHFFRAVSNNDARNEARWFIKNARGLKIDYVFADVEATSLNRDKNKLTDFVNSFFDELDKAGYKHLGIYSGKYFLESRLVESKLRKGILIWIARYNETLGRSADVWQFTSKGSVDGIRGNVDVNIDYSGKLSDGKASYNQNPVSQHKPSGNSRYLDRGDHGSNVKDLQNKLIKAGFSCGSTGADGWFGNDTEKAVIAFQKHAHVGVDGIAGPQTIKALDKELSNRTSGGTYTVRSGDTLSGIGAKTHTNWKTIASINGIKGPDYVIYPGQKLKLSGGTYTVRSGDTLSGIGAKTHTNWKTIASINGIKGPDYVIYPGQKLKLSGGSQPAPKKKSSGGGSSIVPYPGHLIRRGSRGKDVQRIQRAVGVNPDGIFGSGTERAVKAYQKRHGLAADGIVGKATWSVMF